MASWLYDGGLGVGLEDFLGKLYSNPLGAEFYFGFLLMSATSEKEAGRQKILRFRNGAIMPLMGFLGPIPREGGSFNNQHIFCGPQFKLESFYP